MPLLSRPTTSARKPLDTEDGTVGLTLVIHQLEVVLEPIEKTAEDIRPNAALTPKNNNHIFTAVNPDGRNLWLTG